MFTTNNKLWVLFNSCLISLFFTSCLFDDLDFEERARLNSHEWEKSEFCDPVWYSVRDKKDIQALIKNGTQLNPQDSASPLLYAPNYRLKKALLELGADPNHSPKQLRKSASKPDWWLNDGFDLHPMRGIESSKEGRLLKSYGARVPQSILATAGRDFSDKWETRNDRLETVEFFIKNGAEVNFEKYPCSKNTHILEEFQAFPYLNQRILRHYLNCGIDLSASRPGAKAYIFYHCFENQLELIKAGANPNMQDPKNGDTLLIANLRMIAKVGGDDFNTPRLYHFIKQLLKLGADPTIKNKEGRSAVSYAYQDARIQKLLVHYKGDKNELQRLGKPSPEKRVTYPFLYNTFSTY